MLGRFIASDRGFAKARKKGETLCRNGENYHPPRRCDWAGRVGLRSSIFGGYILGAALMNGAA